MPCDHIYELNSRILIILLQPDIMPPLRSKDIKLRTSFRLGAVDHLSILQMETKKLLEDAHQPSGPLSILSQPYSLLSLDPGPSRKGISVLVAVFLVIGFDSSGMLRLPYTLVGTGFWGIGFMVLCLVNVAFCGSRLAVCWEILAEDHEEFNSEPGHATPLSDAYPLIAEMAGRAHSPRLGKLLRFAVIGAAFPLSSTGKSVLWFTK